MHLLWGACTLLAGAMLLTLAGPAAAEPPPLWVAVLEHGDEIAEAWLEQAERDREELVDKLTYEPPLPREANDPPEASVWPVCPPMSFWPAPSATTTTACPEA